MTTYDKIKVACDKRDMSILALEKALDLPRSSICKWKDHSPSLDRIKQIADFFGMTLDELVGDS